MLMFSLFFFFFENICRLVLLNVLIAANCISPAVYVNVSAKKGCIKLDV